MTVQTPVSPYSGSDNLAPQIIFNDYFRELPDLAKQYVMRLLLLDGTISLSTVSSWANTAGQWYTDSSSVYCVYYSILLAAPILTLT